MEALAASLLMMALALGCSAAEAGGPAGSSQPSLRLTNSREIAAPGGAGARCPRISSDGKGRLFLSWLAPAPEKGYALQVASFSNGQWSGPTTVVKGPDLVANWADTPALLVGSQRRLFVSWLESTGPHSYDIYVAASQDDGKTWSEPAVPHRDGKKTEHGFVSMTSAANGGADLIWLDGRKWIGGKEGSAPMTLRFANLSPDGSVGQERELDGMVCDCCPTSMVSSADGPIAVYRDRTESEIRDISLVRSRGAKWEAATSVHNDGWKIDGCPVNGPRIASGGENLAVAWFTGAGEKAIVKLAFSRDRGAHFGKPLTVAEGRPSGRADLAMLADGSAVVTWIEGGEVRSRQLRDDGSMSAIMLLGKTGTSRTGSPHSTILGDQLFIVWPDSSQKVPRLRVSLVEIGRRV